MGTGPPETGGRYSAVVPGIAQAGFCSRAIAAEWGAGGLTRSSGTAEHFAMDAFPEAFQSFDAKTRDVRTVGSEHTAFRLAQH